MLIVGLAGFAALLVASFTVGGRLFLQGLRTRRLPELMIGSAFLFVGGFPGLLMLISDLMDGGRRTGPYADGWMLTVIHLSLLLGVTGLCVFTWRVFRADDRRGLAMFAAIEAMLLLGHLGSAVVSLEPGASWLTFLWIGICGRIAAYAWAVAETTREWLAARRRCALGLTEPIVVHRMLLWAIGLGAVLAIWAHEAVTVAGGGGRGSYLVISLLGFVCAGALWLAFFPPAFYQRRIVATGSSR